MAKTEERNDTNIQYVISTPMGYYCKDRTLGGCYFVRTWQDAETLSLGEAYGVANAYEGEVKRTIP